jgi:hypothetical protein
MFIKAGEEVTVFNDELVFLVIRHFKEASTDSSERLLQGIGSKRIRFMILMFLLLVHGQLGFVWGCFP